MGQAVLELTTDPTGLDRGLTAARTKADRETAAMQATVGKRMDALGAKMGAIGATMTRRVTVPILGLGVAATKMAADFDGAMERVHTQAGESQKNVDKLRGSVIALSKVSAQGPTDLANALYRLEGAGIRGEKAMKALRAASDLAAVGNANVEDTAKTLGQAYFSGIKGLGSFNNVVSELNATVGAGDLKLQQLVDALGVGILPTAKQVGLSFHDITAAMAVFGDETNNVSGWTAQLATSFHFLTNPTTKAQKAFEDLGMKSGQLASDFRKPNGLSTALHDLRDHLDQLPGGAKGPKATNLLGDILPGGRGRVLTVLLNQLDRLDSKYGQIRRTNDSFAEAVAKTHATAAYKIHNSWAKIEADSVQLGHAIGPVFIDVGRQIADDVTKVADAFSKLPKGAQTAIAEGALATAAIGPAMKVAGMATSGAGKLKRLYGAATGTGAAKVRALEQSVGTMQVGEMVVRSMVGGGAPGKGGPGGVIPGGKGDGGKAGGGGAVEEAAKVGAGASAVAVAKRVAQEGVRRGLRAGAIGIGSEVAAHAIGGKVGRDIGGAGTGAAIGSFFGPWGTAAGAGIGLVAAQPGSPARQDLNHLRDLKDQGATTEKQLHQLEKTIGDLQARLHRDPSGPGSDALRTEIGNMQHAAGKLRDELGTTSSAADRASRQVNQKIREMATGSIGSIHGMRAKLGYDMAFIESSFQKGSQGAKNAMGREIGAAIKSLTHSMSTGKVSTKAGMSEIERLVKTHTGASRDITDTNMKLAAEAIKNAMDHGASATRGGTSIIEGYFLAAFRALGVGSSAAKLFVKAGITPSDIKNAQPKGTQGVHPGKPGLAVGGYIGGAGLQDTVPIMAAPGEAVLNRHQQQPVELALRATYGIGLDDLFGQISRPHYMASGGKVPPIGVSGPASALHSLVQGGLDKERSIANRTLSKLASQVAAAGPAGGGGPGSSTGLVPQVLRAIAWAKAHGWHGGITSGFRSLAKQQSLYAQLHGISPVAAPGSSLHERGQAVDVSDIPGFLRAMQTAPPGSRLYSLVAGDPEHFSTTGHARGGFVGYARGGFINAARGLSPRASAAGVPKKPKKAPKGKTVKPLNLPKLSGDAFGFVRAYISKAMNQGASLSELYGMHSELYDLTDSDLSFVVTPTSYTGADGKPVYLDAAGNPVASASPYVDEAAVAIRIGHLSDLLTLQTQVKSRLSDALKYTQRLIPALIKGIRQRSAEIAKIRARIHENLKKIKALEAQLKAEQRKALPKGKHHAAAAAAKKKRVNSLTDQINALKDDNQHLGGNRDSIGTGGALGTLLNQRQTFSDALDTGRSNVTDLQGVSGQGGEIGDAGYTILQLQQQIGQLGPDALATALRQAQLASGSVAGGDGASAADTTLADLLAQQNQQLTQQLAVSQAQYKVLAQMPPFGGSFADGGVVPGPVGAARTIVAHGGEVIGQAGGASDVHLHFAPGTEWLRDFVKVEVGQQTRRTARAAGRGLPGAGGR